VDSTCSQRGCHLTEDVNIRLGKMTGQTGLHCMVCHKFTRVVPGLATFDSAKGSLTPGSKQCFSCHAMREKLADFNPDRDPHSGTCGMCHNPHENVKPKDALKSCADAGCHGDWRQVDFHQGAAHRRLATRCEACHTPHAARVDASDCVGCHESAKARAQAKRRPPVPFDTTKALQRTSGPTEVPSPSPHGKGDAPIDDPPAPPPAPPDSSPRPFSHRNHKKLPCITCHDVKSKASSVTFKAPRGCLICHHQQPAKSDCATCHAPSALQELQFSETIHIQTTARGAPDRARTVAFSHAGHTSVTCGTCHTAPVTLAPSPQAVQCQGCHVQHHEAGRDCAACHRSATSDTAHTRASHVDCTTCHQQATTLALLTPNRAFCLGCHDAKVDHQAPTECSACHLLATPAEFRPQLMGLH
jgi:predicted CXXCH cytochrome family protein